MASGRFARVIQAVELDPEGLTNSDAVALADLPPADDRKSGVLEALAWVADFERAAVGDRIVQPGDTLRHDVEPPRSFRGVHAACD